MKRVMFDIDGVLADFIKGFTMIGWNLFGIQPRSCTDSQHWDDFGDLTKEQQGEIWKQLHANQKFWEKLPALVKVETFDRIDMIIDEGIAEIYFVTNRSSKNAKLQTENWLIAHGIDNPTVITTGKKAEVAKALDIHLSIEDKASNADMIAWWTDGRTESYVLDRLYNAGVHAPHSTKVKRVQTVDQFLNLFDQQTFNKSAWGSGIDKVVMDSFIRSSYPDLFLKG